MAREPSPAEILGLWTGAVESSLLSGITVRLLPEAALPFVQLRRGKSRDGVKNLKLNLRNGFSCICFSFSPVGLCTVAFPIEADTGFFFFSCPSVLSL